jgi:hypothetical protein
LVIEQVATPAVSGVVEVHVTPVQATEPAGVPPGPLTVAVKTKVPPVEMEPWLSVTTVVEVAAAITTLEAGLAAVVSCEVATLNPLAG